MRESASSFARLFQELELLFLIVSGEFIVSSHDGAHIRAYEEETGENIFLRVIKLLDACEQDLAARAGTPDGDADTQRYDMVMHRALSLLEQQFRPSLKRALRKERRKFLKPDRARIRAWVRLGIRSMRRSSH